MTRMIMTLLCCLAAMPALAEGARLRSEINISSNIVHLGDLVDGAGDTAGAPLFRAPDLGTTGRIGVGRVVDAVRGKIEGTLDTQGLTEVVVHRLGRTISLDEISTAVTAEIAMRSRVNAEISLTLDSSAQPKTIEPDASGPLRVTRVDWNAATGRFDATLAVDGSEAAGRTPIRVGGTAIEVVEVPVFARALTRGEILRPGDVTLDRLPRSQSRQAVVASAGAATGQALRRAVRPGQPVFAADLMKPDMVSRNDMVTIAYEIPGLTLTIRGKALDNGAEGDAISILNAQSSRVVQAIVTGPGRVSVQTRSRLVLN